MKIIIPARAGSKGFQNKNKILFEYTAKVINSLYDKYRSFDLSDVIVSSNDFDIEAMTNKNKFRYIKRSEDLAGDYASMKDVLLDLIEQNIIESELCFVLYLTYPERTVEQIKNAMDFFYYNRTKSLLCKQEIKDHPYLCMYTRQHYRGDQIISHNLYRRQDYPNCFKISHYIIMMESNEIKFLNHNLYNQDTLFMPIGKEIDIDTEQDYEKFLRGKNAH